MFDLEEEENQSRDITDYVDSLAKNQQAAEKVLQELKNLPKAKVTFSIILDSLKQCAFFKYRIPPTERTDFTELGIYSLKQSDTGGQMDEEKMAAFLTTEDCHRLPLVLHMKTTFIIFVERYLQLSFSDEEATDVQNLEELAALIFQHMKGSRFAREDCTNLKN